MLHRKLELTVKAGIPPARAARLLGQERQLGSIAPGKVAQECRRLSSQTDKLGVV
jgi:hypothetical protein